MKIFISAYACEPYKGSEPGIGWSFVNEMAKYHDVHVLTRANNQQVIESAVSSLNNPNLSFHYYDVPKSISFWKKKRRGYQIYYYLWQILAYRKYKDFVNNSGFDIVHHLTFGADWMPSLFMKCKPYTIWGPIGSEDIPKFVYDKLPLRLKVKESIRSIIKKFFYHVEPLRKASLKHADLILSHSSEYAKYKYPVRYKNKVQKQIQTGLNTNEPEYEMVKGYAPQNSGTTRLIIASELVDWKGVVISAEVFGRIASNRDDVELVVLGEGPEKQRMIDVFSRYKVLEKVIFKGFVDKQKLVKELYQADILLYPAYHHGLATIILQAMYCYLPIISMHGDIISEVVKGKCGLITLSNRYEDIVFELESNTNELIVNLEMRNRLSNNAHALAKSEYSWQHLVLAINKLYQDKLG